MPPPSPRQLREIPPRYAAIMAEIKNRFCAIRAGVDGYLSILPPPIVYEHCYLQIRMICELVGSACLLAHGDIPAAATKTILNEWNADRIFSTLGKLHPKFYPEPVFLQMPTSYDNPFPKQKLISVYHRCGQILHRGGLTELFKKPKSFAIDWTETKAIVEQLYRLLYIHMITTADENVRYIVTLYRSDTGGVGIGVINKADPGQSTIPWWDVGALQSIFMGPQRRR